MRNVVSYTLKMHIYYIFLFKQNIFGDWNMTKDCKKMQKNKRGCEMPCLTYNNSYFA